jgi:DNA-binding PadR family transcriptional regulator
LTPNPSEAEEWADELERVWTEVYKKSMTTALVLKQLLNEAKDADEIGKAFTRTTGWNISERAMYRTLRRLTNSGVLAVEEVPAARTGAKRKLFRLTPLGAELLSRVEGQLVAWT